MLGPQHWVWRGWQTVQLDACIVLSNKPWDTAAGIIIARETGALVVDSVGDHHTFASGETIAVASSIASQLLRLVGGGRT
jgi:myo-inositol-1(or 4)-monophosphatase